MSIMVKTVFDFLQFMLANVPLLTSLTVFALLSVVLARLVKRRSRLCYLVAAIPALLVAVPLILRWCGVEVSGFTGVPVLGQILRDYIHMGTLGHPLLIVIMYMGALDARREWVRRLMSIRGELSILVGFPVLTHSLVRVASVTGAWKFFTDQQGYLSATPVTSVTGAWFTNFSFLLGVILIVLFVPLWLTSFPAVRRRMGAVRWKRLQRWAYVMYAVMFLHAAGIQAGGMLNPRGGGSGSGMRPATEQVVQAAPVGRAMPKGFADFKIDPKIRGWIHLSELLLIYGSYLCLRLRKAKAHPPTRQR
jgi:DMSO/TMAO reductase YedYZ heme-binding membrane subunit